MLSSTPLSLPSLRKWHAWMPRHHRPYKLAVHVERWLMFARDLYLRKRFSMNLVPTIKMMADLMTKVVDRDKFLKCRDYVLGGDS